MKTHSFVVIASGLDPHAEDFEDRFFDTGCDDATIAVQKGAIILEFDRWAECFSEALGSAITDVCATGAKVMRVEPDHLVSLSDVAARAGLTRAAVSHYAKGERGEQFPAPVVRVTSESPLWDWAEVAQWLHDRDRLGAEELLRARVLRRANLAIMARNAGHIADLDLGSERHADHAAA